MFKHYPAKAPNKQLEALFAQYKAIFSTTPVAPETLSLLQRPPINVKEVLVEVPFEKLGIPPKKQQAAGFQKGK